MNVPLSLTTWYFNFDCFSVALTDFSLKYKWKSWRKKKYVRDCGQHTCAITILNVVSILILLNMAMVISIRSCSLVRFFFVHFGFIQRKCCCQPISAPKKQKKKNHRTHKNWQNAALYKIELYYNIGYCHF